tara:strand:- start:581 stop:1114 length:534 start_codon:yes stop_codon:yes gene_type:complete
MNTKTKNLVAKSTSEGWARANSFQKLLHTVMGTPDKELGTASQARSFISANKHHNIIDNITDATKDGKPINITTVQKLKPLLASYQQFLLGHKKTIKRRNKPTAKEIALTVLKKVTTASDCAQEGSCCSVSTTNTVNGFIPGIEALQDLRTFQLKHKLTIKDITHLAQTLQDLQIPR